MRTVTAFVRFSRPHTVVGTVVGICALYAIVVARAGEQPSCSPPRWWWVCAATSSSWA